MQIIHQLTVCFTCPQSSSLEQAVLVPSIHVPTATDEVKVISIQEWQQALERCKSKDFKQAITILQELCGEGDSLKLKIQTESQLLTFEIYKSEYWSEAVWKGAFEGRKKDHPPRQYYYFKLYENEDADDCLMHVRSDLAGKYVELCKIKKGEHLTGRKLLGELCMPFLEAMHFEVGLLHDDAMKSLFLGDNEVKLYLRMLLPIVSKTGSAEEGQALYSRYKFVPFVCHHLLHFDEKHQATQDPKAYYSALEHVRTRKISNLATSIFSYSPFTKQIIHKLTTRNLPRCTPESTLSDLGGEIFTRAKSKTAESAQAARDLVSFATVILEVRESLPKNSNQEARIFNLALSTLLRHYLWVRHFKTPAVDQSYKEYLTSPHTPFDDYAKRITLTHKTDWDELGRKLYMRAPVTSFYQPSPMVEIGQVDHREFIDQVQKLKSHISPMQAISSLSELCTKANFADDPLNCYWQLWIEVFENTEHIDLELVITAKNRRFELSVNHNANLLLHITVSEQLTLLRPSDVRGKTAHILQAIQNYLLPSSR